MATSSVVAVGSSGVVAAGSAAFVGAAPGPAESSLVPAASGGALLPVLPNLAVPSDLGDLAEPTLVDPMLLDGRVDLEQRRQDLFRQVSSLGQVDVGDDVGVLRDDWANIFEHNQACNVLFDLSSIWERARDKADVEGLCREWFDHLLSEKADFWHLDSAVELQQSWPSHVLWPRCLAQVWDFFGESFSLSSHCVAQGYEDNFLSLLRKDFRTSENSGEALFSVGRWTLLVAQSGAGKSPMLGRVEEHLKSQAVRQSFELVAPRDLANLKGFHWYSAQGANLEGFLTLAEKCNDPVGLRFLLEEVSLTVGRITERRADRLGPEDVIRLANPRFSTGKRLKTSASEIQDLKVVMTAGVQGAFAHLYLPFSHEGESYRWTPAVSPPSKGLDTSRADKLTAKSASQQFVCQLLAVHVTKNLAAMPSGARLLVCKEARACANALVLAAKQALKGFQVRKGAEQAQQDPVYSLYLGKLDGQYMQHLVASWALGEALLAWLNPLYRPQLRSTGVYARLALKRALLCEGDRRCLMLSCRRHIESDTRLRAMIPGADPEKVEQLMSKRAQQAFSSAPRTDAEKEAYVLQKVFGLAATVDDVPRVITVASLTALARADALVRRVVGNHAQMVDFFDALSTRHRVVVAFGVPVHLKPQEPLVWTELPAGARVERVRPLGRPGGTGGCPAVRLVPAEDERFVPLLEKLSQAWSAV